MSVVFTEKLGIAAGTGPEYSRLMIVGAYPTLEEVSRGLSFSGTSERFLERLFTGTGVRLREVYRTHYCKKLLTVSKKDKKARRELKVIDETYKDNTFLADLLNEIKLIRPNVIIAMGELPMNVLTEEYNIRNHQGSILNLHVKHNGAVQKVGIKVIPILSVQDMYSEYWTIGHTTSFLRRAVKWQNNDKPFEEKHLLWICKNYESLWNYYDRNRDPEFVVSDIETYLGYISCISFCTDGYEAVSVPLLDSDYSNIELALMWKLIGRWLSNKKVINQNVAYDAYYCNRWGIPFGTVYDCNMLLSNTVYPELPKSLAFQTAIHTEIQYYKDEGKEMNVGGGKDKQKFYFYNAKDALTAFQSYVSLKEDAKELKIWDFYQRGPQKFLTIYRKISDYGVRTDESQIEVLRTKYKALLETHRSHLYDLASGPVNYNAFGQVGELLYNVYKLPSRTHVNEKGIKIWSTDEATLDDLVLNANITAGQKNVCHAILYCRKLHRVLETLNCFIHPDGRLRTVWKPDGTDSGRTSTAYHYDRMFYVTKNGKVKYDNMGFALQTFSKHGYEFDDGTVIRSDLRSIFIPSPGYTFVSADSSQAEARIVALLAEDYELLESFDCRDVHIWTAAFILQKLESLITEEEREKKGKRPRHAGNYDMQFKKLGSIARLPVLEAKVALERFHEFSPKIRRIFHEGVRKLVTQYRYLTNSFGRRRDFLDRTDDNLFRVAYSWIPQSTVSDNTKFAMMNVWNELPFPDCQFLGEFHDGLFAETKIGEEEKWRSATKKWMEKPIDFRKCTMQRNYDLVIPVKFERSDTNWGNLQKWK